MGRRGAETVCLVSALKAGPADVGSLEHAGDESLEASISNLYKLVENRAEAAHGSICNNLHFDYIEKSSVEVKTRRTVIHPIRPRPGLSSGSTDERPHLGP